MKISEHQKRLITLKPEYANDNLVHSLQKACGYVLSHRGTASSRLMAAFLKSLHSDYPARLNSCIGFLDAEHIEWLMDSMRAVHVHKMEPQQFFRENMELFVEIAKCLPKAGTEENEDTNGDSC